MNMAKLDLDWNSVNQRRLEPNRILFPGCTVCVDEKKEITQKIRIEER